MKTLLYFILGYFMMFSTFEVKAQSLQGKTWVIETQTLEANGNNLVIYDVNSQENVNDLSNISLNFFDDGNYTGTGLTGRPISGNYIYTNGTLDLGDGETDDLVFINQDKFQLSKNTSAFGADTQMYPVLSTSTYVSLSFLPVEMISFEVNLHNQAISLEWKTEQEEGFSHFDIERAVKNKPFIKIAKTPSKGTGSIYEFLDNDYPESSAEIFYRLKMVDQDGTFSYSEIRSVRLEIKHVQVYPAPFTDNLYVSNNNVEVNSYQIKNMLGQIVIESKISDVNSHAIDTSELAPGNYSITIFQDRFPIHQQLIVKL